MSNPLDEYLMEKAAFLGAKDGKRLGDAAGSAAIQFGVATAMMAGPAVAQKIVSAVTKRHSYNNMLTQNPDLSDKRDEDPKTFNNFYNSFHRMNPQFASDPVVAGTYIRQMMEHPVNAGKIIVESMKGSPNRSPSFGDAWKSGVQAGMKEMGGTPPQEDPLAEQRQRVQGMELGVKEHELGRKQQQLDADAKQLGLFG